MLTIDKAKFRKPGPAIRSSSISGRSIVAGRSGRYLRRPGQRRAIAEAEVGAMIVPEE